MINIPPALKQYALYKPVDLDNARNIINQYRNVINYPYGSENTLAKTRLGVEATKIYQGLQAKIDAGEFSVDAAKALFEADVRAAASRIGFDLSNAEDAAVVDELISDPRYTFQQPS